MTWTLYCTDRNIDHSYLNNPIVKLLQELKKIESKKPVRKKVVLTGEIDKTLLLTEPVLLIVDIEAPKDASIVVNTSPADDAKLKSPSGKDGINETTTLADGELPSDPLTGFLGTCFLSIFYFFYSLDCSFGHSFLILSRISFLAPYKCELFLLSFGPQLHNGIYSLYFLHACLHFILYFLLEYFDAILFALELAFYSIINYLSEIFNLLTINDF